MIWSTVPLQVAHHAACQVPRAVFVSAHREGIDQLRATIESLLPRPEIEIRALIPYERGDLSTAFIKPASSSAPSIWQPARSSSPG